MKRIIIIVLLSLFFPVFFVKAQSASLYLSPASGTFFVGSTFDVSIFVDTEGNSINAIRADLDFPPDLLQVTSPTAGQSFVSVWADQPLYSNQDGFISFKGGVQKPGIKTSAGLISTITFRVKAPGEANIFFLNSSQVLLADGQGTNILKTVSGGRYIFILQPPEGPVISSPTHTCLTCWYKNNNPTFFWEKNSQMTDVSFSIDKDPRGFPDNVSEGLLSSASYNDIEDGIWYFHLKAKEKRIWGGVSHYSLRIDQTPPRNFDINLEKVGTRFFAYFLTEDLLSGMDHYEISTINMSEPKEAINPFFVEAENVYQLPFESVGRYAVLVRAYDKAGNYLEKKSALSIVSPFLSYTDKGIKLKWLFLPWWLIQVLLFVILGSAVFLVYKLVHRKGMAEKLKKEVREAEREIKDVKEIEEKIQKMRALEEEARKEAERLASQLRRNGEIKNV